MVGTNQAIRAAREYSNKNERNAIVKMVDDPWGVEVHLCGSVAYKPSVAEMADDLGGCLFITGDRNLVIY